MDTDYDLGCLIGTMERQLRPTLDQSENQDLLSEENKQTLEWKNFVEKVQEVTGYKFRNINLLHQAFTHSSFQERCESYERLEYVGDSVLNLLIAKEHYFLYPDLAPGMLTRLRAANVDTEKLARVAAKYDLHKYLRHKKPLLKGQVVEGLLQPLITPANLETHPATKLYEVCQKNGWSVELIDTWERTGEIQILVDGKFAGKGKFGGKKLIALNRAAHNAYWKIFKNWCAETTCDYGADNETQN
ncbi:unnamed protein product [Withania somnifera]